MSDTTSLRDEMLDEPTESLIHRLIRAAWVAGKNDWQTSPLDTGVIALELIRRAAPAEAHAGLVSVEARWKVYAKHQDDCIAQPPPVGAGEGCSCGLLTLAREYALAQSAALATPPAVAPEEER